MKFLHVSDLHFHMSNEDNIQVTNMLNTLNENYPNHYFIVTGDITDDGNDKQLQNAYDSLKPFLGRIFICPGNHDFGAAGNFYSKSRAKDFDKHLAAPLEQGGTFYGNNEPIINVVSDTNDKIMLIALDSNLETSHPFDFACGEVGEPQLNYIEAVLSDPNSAKMKKILFLHHHPFIQDDPFMELKDAKQFMRAIYGRVDVLMFGHKHKSKYWKNHGGISHIIASDNSPGYNNIVREIAVESDAITVADVPC